MATFYTCDRCATTILGPGRQHSREVEIEWPNDDTQKETVKLTFSVSYHLGDPDTPDLCGDCYAHILREVASRLDTDKTPMERA